MLPARRASLLASVLLPATLLLVYACGDSDGSSNFDDGLSGLDGGDGAPPGTSSGFIPTDTGARDVVQPDQGDGTLEAVIRDFKKWTPGDSTTNPDFENVPFDDLPDGGRGDYDGPFTEATNKWFPTAPFKLDIVQETLGADNVPLYNTSATYRDAGRTATTHGKSFFDQWYRDVPGTNVTRRVKLQLTKSEAGVYSYDSAVSGVRLSDAAPGKQFFPIDDNTDASTNDAGFGNQGNLHNYHFTVELRTKFTYRGNETFKFSGDDDVFVYINKKLVINIGGIHEALSREVKLLDVAAAIGLVVGNEYTLDFFQAERHVTESNLRIDTTIDLRPAPIVR